MKRAPFYGILAIILLSVAATPVLGQGKVAIMFDGVTPVGNMNFFGRTTGVTDLGAMKPSNVLLPGLEVRVHPKGRASLGVGYPRWSLKSGPEPREDRIVNGPNAGEIACTYNLTQKADANVVVGTVYVNLTRNDKIRPFIGAGAGYASFRSAVDLTDHWWSPLIVGSRPKEVHYRETLQRVVIKGVGGLNIYPAKRVFLSIGGGYISGPAVNFGAGITF